MTTSQGKKGLNIGDDNQRYLIVFRKFVNNKIKL